MKDLVEIVREYSLRIDNGRTMESANNHLRGEADELEDEIYLVRKGETAGEDGVVGEAIDIIACALDIIFLHKPDITKEELYSIMERKCQKWEKFYSDSVEKKVL